MSLKMTFISDTHGQEPLLPGGDLLIHCGDLSVHGFRVEVIKALNYLHEQKDKYKEIVVIPGNHDLFAERHLLDFKKACAAAGLHCLFNEGQSILGKTLWGSPYTPSYHNWAFNSNEDELKKIWSQISTCDILVTHGPPQGILDEAHGVHLGCPLLLDRVLKIKPKIHVFGHVHESPGILDKDGIIFINCATKPHSLVLT